MERSAVVVTVVHHPNDARIRHREIQALLDAGWRVTYAAPFADYGLTRPVGIPGLEPVDLPRSQGRDRLTALRAARRLLRKRSAPYDVVVLHDPELVPATVGLDLPPVVWDVHEDTAAAMQVRGWLPGILRGPVQWAVRGTERWPSAGCRCCWPSLGMPTGSANNTRWCSTRPGCRPARPRRRPRAPAECNASSTWATSAPSAAWRRWSPSGDHCARRARAGCGWTSSEVLRAAPSRRWLPRTGREP